MAGTDVRVRVRPGVIRIRIAEAGIRPVISVTTPQAQLPYPLSTYRPESLSRPFPGPTEGPGGPDFFGLQVSVCQ